MKAFGIIFQIFLPIPLQRKVKKNSFSFGINDKIYFFRYCSGIFLLISSQTSESFQTNLFVISFPEFYDVCLRTQGISVLTYELEQKIKGKEVALPLVSRQGHFLSVFPNHLSLLFFFFQSQSSFFPLSSNISSFSLSFVCLFLCIITIFHNLSVNTHVMPSPGLSLFQVLHILFQ